MVEYRKSISIENGNIVAGFPFNDEVTGLKDNFNVALRRLQSPLCNLQGDKEKYSMYNETFHSYLREGIIEEAKDNSNRAAKFYLPHRHVWTPSKVFSTPRGFLCFIARKRRTQSQ
ncbi:unnamed protein product [Heligmosomoides polygyrus]|uniref:SERPIN domain-containing protein n=1 Tax=Heligmosomoides polygyrus TaxID=6339 RepID=A0A183GJZ8_HELPZ|nr:unnamed protein product [Heligmosomoides polygyrus]